MNYHCYLKLYYYVQINNYYQLFNGGWKNVIRGLSNEVTPATHVLCKYNHRAHIQKSSSTDRWPVDTIHFDRYNRPSGHWLCVKSCLVGGRDKYIHFSRSCSGHTDLVECVVSLATVVGRGFLTQMPREPSICVTRCTLTCYSGLRGASLRL